MGQTLPSLAVKRFTAVEQEQIKSTYSVLCQRSGTTKINQPTFIQYWADYVDPIIADRLWLIFDTKFDSLLDFEEWSTGLANTLRGNKDDRSKLISNIFDIDNHGYVTEANVRKLFATNLFAARNIIKPFDWEAYETAKQNAASESANEYVKALYSFTGSNDMELSFTEGAVMQLLQKVDADWWWCELEEKQGYVPANYIEPVKTAVKSGKMSKFQTIKRGMELEVLVFSLLKLQNSSGKIPRDAFLQWALEHEMDLCLNALEKVDLRANRAQTIQPQEAKAPAPPGTLAAPTPTAATAPAPPVSTTPPKQPVTTEANAPIDPSLPTEIPAAALRPDVPDASASRISPELATVLRAAGIADKELDDNAMSEFVNWFIDKHAPKVGTVAGRRRPRASRIDDTVHRRPLPEPEKDASSPTAPVAPAPPAITVTPTGDELTANPTRISLHDQIKAGKALKPSRKKTNLATLSKKDLTGLGLLLRVQIDSRRNLIAMSDDDDSSDDGEFD